jgi:hypothetical protein
VRPSQMMSTGLMLVCATWIALVLLLTTISFARAPAIEVVLEGTCPVVYVPLAHTLEKRVHRLGPRLYWPVVVWRDKVSGASIETFPRNNPAVPCNVVKMNARSIQRNIRDGQVTPELRVDYLALLTLCLLPSVPLAGIALLIRRRRAAI